MINMHLIVFPPCFLNCGAAGCQHGIHDYDLTLINGNRQLAVVFVRLVGFRIAVESDMPDLRGRHQGRDPVYHAQSGTQDRNDSQLLPGKHRRHTFLNGSLHLHFLQRQVAERFKTDQDGDLLYQLAEFVGSGFLFAEQGDLVLN